MATVRTNKLNSKTTPEVELDLQEVIYALTKVNTPTGTALEVAASLVPEVVRFIRSRLDEVEPGRRKTA